MLQISRNVSIPEAELEFTAVRAQGAGGQNVNKVSTAIHLRFDIPNSSLPDFYKDKLMQMSDHRITKEGVVIIKAQSSRSQDTNKAEAMERLQALIKKATFVQKKRRATKPTKGSQKRRLEGKARRGKVKAMRKKIDY